MQGHMAMRPVDRSSMACKYLQALWRFLGNEARILNSGPCSGVMRRRTVPRGDGLAVRM